ncbi:hypothetical protein DICA4_C07360 [Diutina catenulata]
MSTPATPIHSAPTAEVPEIPDDVENDLDLNPDLYEMSDTEEPPQTRDQLPQIDTFTNSVDIEIDRAKSEFTDAPQLLRDGQISQLVMDIDNKMLAVQRRFIKSQAGEVPCSLFELFDDLAVVINELWRTVITRNRLFGQQDYFIRIVGEVEDWLLHYRRPFAEIKPPEPLEPQQYRNLVRYFTFFQSLDVKLSVLVDGYQGPRSTQKISRTEMVRLVPLINRVRVVIANQIGPLVERLENLRDETYVPLRQVLDIELTRVFEGLLDRANS